MRTVGHISRTVPIGQMREWARDSHKCAVILDALEDAQQEIGWRDLRLAEAQKALTRIGNMAAGVDLAVHDVAQEALARFQSQDAK